MTSLDLLIDPSSAILTAKFAESRGLLPGSTLEVNTGDRLVLLTVRGLLEDRGPARVLDGRLVLMDIAAAQQTLNRFGRISRIEVRVGDDTTVDVAESGIRSRLPHSLTVQRPAIRGRQVERMLAAFHLNLSALSYVALLVGLFLVYNTVSVAVLSRRDEIGTLRGLGVTRGGVRALFLAEAAAFAVIGCAAGVLIGRVLADATIALTSTTVTTLYIAEAAAPAALAWRDVVLAFGIGIPLSLGAALVPAIEASRVAPIAAMRGADRLLHRTAFPARSLASGLTMLAVGAWLATRGPMSGLPIFGYAAALVIVLGASCLVPAVLYVVTHSLDRWVRRLLRVEGWLAVNNLAAAVPRLSISVAALSVSLSMMIAIAVMVGSFRATVIAWIGQTLQADLFISPGSRGRIGSGDTLSPEIVGLVRGNPDVTALGEYRTTEVVYREMPIRVGATDLELTVNRGTLAIKSPADAVSAVPGAVGQDAVVASESFAIRHGARVGDSVVLPTRLGEASFRIAAIYYDYSSDRGVLLMDRATFAKHYGDRLPVSLSVYLRPGVDPEQARERILASGGDTHQLAINTNRSLRTEVLRIFDSTFAITYALELVAIVVAILGVSGTLLTLILERAPELTMLRLVGTLRGQVRRMVIGEAALIGAISQTLGLVIGLALSVVLIYVINVQSFGWTIQFICPFPFLSSPPR